MLTLRALKLITISCGARAFPEVLAVNVLRQRGRATVSTPFSLSKYFCNVLRQAGQPGSCTSTTKDCKCLARRCVLLKTTLGRASAAVEEIAAAVNKIARQMKISILSFLEVFKDCKVPDKRGLMPGVEQDH